jgi:hypothetical protein
MRRALRKTALFLIQRFPLFLIQRFPRVCPEPVLMKSPLWDIMRGKLREEKEKVCRTCRPGCSRFVCHRSTMPICSPPPIWHFLPAENASVLNCSQVCPEPVLVNRSFCGQKADQKELFPHRPRSSSSRCNGGSSGARCCSRGRGAYGQV